MGTNIIAPTFGHGRFLLGAGAVFALGAAASGGTITSVTWGASAGARAASATFSNDGGSLVVSLRNTSQSDVLNPSEVLTSMFFNISGSTISLSRDSAVVPGGSTVLFGGTDPGGVVGGEWAYNSGLHNAPGDNTYGISSSGLNFSGPHDRFPGSNLAGPESPGGIDYGITSAGDDPNVGNTPVTGTNPLIKNEAVFHLGGLPSGFDPLTRITSVTFQYGTSTSEPSLEGHIVPAPGAIGLLTLGGLIAARHRRRSS